MVVCTLCFRLSEEREVLVWGYTRSQSASKALGVNVALKTGRMERAGVVSGWPSLTNLMSRYRKAEVFGIFFGITIILIDKIIIRIDKITIRIDKIIIRFDKTIQLDL